jgi:hypothetical protein
MGSGEYAHANSFAERHISLPLWRTMPEADVERFVEVVRVGLQLMMRLGKVAELMSVSYIQSKSLSSVC